MKKLYSLLIFSFCCISVIAVNPSLKREKKKATSKFNRDYRNLLKSDSDCDMIMDSIIYFDAITNEKTEFSLPFFDSNDRMSSVLFYEYQAENKILYEKVEYEYYSDGQLKKESYYDYENGEWMPTYQTSYTYYKGNKIATETGENWDEEKNKWQPSHKEEFTYTATDSVETEKYLHWRTDLNEWSEDTFITHEYDENNILTLSYSYGWNYGVWDVIYKIIYSYDENSFLTEKNEYQRREDNTYEDFARYRTTYINDKKGRKTEEISYYNYNEETGDLDSKTKWEYAYDKHENISMEAYYIYYKEIGEWIGEERIESIYDDCNLLKEYRESYEWENGEWIESEYAIAYYTPRNPQSINYTETHTGFIYYSDNCINVNYENIQSAIIYSVAGQVLLQTTEKSIPTYDMAKGIYIVQVNLADGSKVVEKLFIR